MIEVTSFGGQNWLITPAALAVNETRPASISAQKWLLVLSGVGIINMQGETANDWRHDSVHIVPDMKGPLDYAINRFSIPRPSGNEGTNYNPAFQVEEWSPFVGLSSIFDQNQSVNAGFAVDAWRPSPFGTGNDAFSQARIGNLFSGVIADVAVRDSDAWLYRLGYNMTLLGRIVFIDVVF
jgi:hypothetical protein